MRSQVRGSCCQVVYKLPCRVASNFLCPRKQQNATFADELTGRITTHRWSHRRSHKNCSACHATLAARHFYLNYHNSGLSSSCKSCTLQRQHKWSNALRIQTPVAVVEPADKALLQMPKVSALVRVRLQAFSSRWAQLHVSSL